MNIIAVADKNAPSGKAVFMVALFKNTNPIPQKAASQIESRIIQKAVGNPNKNPISITIFISPKPSHLPREAKNIIPKIPAAVKPVINKLKGPAV